MESDKNIKSLTEKYFNGETTLQEEIILRELMKEKQSEETSSAEQKALKEMFSMFHNDRQITLRKKINPRRKLTRRFVWGCAAAVLLLAPIYLLTNKKSDIIYCYVNGKPIKEYSEALYHSQQAFEKINNAMTNTNEMLENVLFEISDNL